MLVGMCVSPARAAELAAWPKATPELVAGIIQKCQGRAILNPGAYLATAIANAVEPKTVRAVREASRAIRGVSETAKQQQIAKLRATEAGRGARTREDLEAVAADLSRAPPVEIGGVQVGHGAASAWACQGHLLIFEKLEANDGAAIFAFEAGERDLARLPGVLAIIRASEIPPPQAQRTG